MNRTGALPDGFTLLQVTPRLEDGGVERVTLDIAAAAARVGAVSLVASRGGQLEEALSSSGAEIIRLRVDRRDPLALALNARRLARLIRRRGVSLVHVRSRAPAFSALWAARAAGVPLVATYHGIYSAGDPLKRWYNAVMTRGDLTIANSLFTRDHVITEHGLGADRLALVPEGVDTNRFNPARVSPERVAAMRAGWGVAGDDPTPTILLAARLTGWKGQGLMIQALSRLAPTSRPRLVLAGKTESPVQAAEIAAAAAGAGVAEQVRVAGPIEDMPAAYAAADLVVAPSTLPESFGRSVVEAAAMARPLIASPLGGPAETIVHGQTGWLAAAGDASAWAAAVETTLALDPAARARVGAAARDRAVRLYSLEAMSEATFAVYRGVLERRS